MRFISIKVLNNIFFFSLFLTVVEKCEKAERRSLDGSSPRVYSHARWAKVCHLLSKIRQVSLLYIHTCETSLSAIIIYNNMKFPLVIY